MSQLGKRCKWMTDQLNRAECVPIILTRIVLAQVFIESGWGKLHNLEKVTGFFASLGIPAPQIQAPCIAALELVGGIAVLLGAGTRIFSFLLACTMLVALVTAKREDIASFSDLTGLSEFLYLVLFTWLIFKGPGKCSVDEKLCCRK